MSISEQTRLPPLTWWLISGLPSLFTSTVWGSPPLQVFSTRGSGSRRLMVPPAVLSAPRLHPALAASTSNTDSTGAPPAKVLGSSRITELGPFLEQLGPELTFPPVPTASE